ncbi:MAG TPA: sialate O-acetylesterase, partial [Prolixibacteraceae bacterium]|nr:sialate O-acetylesterase [Prolixibacteraceae bacterium]
KIVWNGQKFKVGTDSNLLIQRVVEKLPGVPVSENEAYALNICADSAVLTATSGMGLFRGLQTVKQLTLEENGQIREVEGLKYSTNPQLSSGEFMLAPLFGEHMVFQQNKPVQIFGTSGAGDQIKVVFDHQSGVCETGIDGHWELSLPQVKAGGPYPLKIFVNGKSVTDWKDILVGDVWFCSGQSNMAFRLDQSADGRKEAERASDNKLRLMNCLPIASTSDEMWDTTALKRINRLDYFEGSWQTGNRDEAAGFSAIAWHFGKELREKLGVPVGLVQVAVGGAPAESFIDRRTIEDDPQLSNILSDWFGNELVMEWCRERALKNVSLQNPLQQRHPFMPSYIFDACVSAFKGFPVRGVIWYQGESNAHNPEYYELAFPALVGSWRQLWGNAELPFLYAQLSSIQRPGWEIFRECQRKMALKIPNTGMVVTSDLGDSLNVHPVHKKEIGHRFALQALQKVYGKDIMADGPMPGKAEIKDGLLEISFPGHLLETSGSDPIRELEVAGEDGIFRQVPGKLSADKIIVQTGNQKIKQVRYAWKPFSRGNLTNREGLPASTFNIIVN